MRHFYYACWFAQLLVGIGLIAISLIIKYSVLQPFFKTTILALMLALLLETAKVTTIIWHRYFVSHLHYIYPDSIRWISLFFKVGLLVVSMFCSIAYLSNQLVDSNQAMLASSLSLIKAMVHWQAEPSQFVFVFSVSISVLIELGILLSFETVTVSMQSLMQKQQQYALEKQELKEQIRSRKDAEKIKHHADIETIQNAAERTIDKAKTTMVNQSG